jgi:hypothetical protein
MIHLAAFPSWLIIVIVVMMVSQFRFMAARRRRDLPDDVRDRLRNRLGGVDERRFEEALNQRDQVIEDLQRRLSEMESRLDFSERLLAEKSQGVSK